MGRKKKKETPVKAETLQVGYAGNVTVQTIRNKKVIKTVKQHNEGGLPLFHFLANCLKGAYNASQRPFYAVPIKLKDDESGYVAASGTAVPLSSIKVNIDETTKAVTTVYKVLIPNTLIPSGTDSYDGVVILSTEYNKNILPNHPIDDFSMRVLLEQPISAADPDNSQLITWNLSIENKAS